MYLVYLFIGNILSFITVAGSVGIDLPKMIKLFANGLEFSSTKDAYELDYGLVEIPFGRVSFF